MQIMKPCPFCGHPGVEISDFGVTCQRCRAQVSASLSVETDAQAWNRRPSPWQPIETAPKVEGKTDDDVIDLWVVDPKYPNHPGRRVCGAWWEPENPARYYPEDRPAGWWGPHESYAEQGRIPDGDVPTHWTPAPKPPET